jgi:hypothetical protein
MVEILADVVDDLTSHVDNVKKMRKPRKKRIITADKKVSKVIYQKKDDNFKIVSLEPIRLLGAKEVWLFNTKYKYISVYRAQNDSGLDVKGTTLQNYDESRSFFKRTGRRPQQYLDSITAATKIRIGKAFEEIPGEAQTVNGRINENTVILRIF